MAGIEKVVLAQGLSAVLPGAWEYFAESDDGIYTFAIGMRSATCNANFELLNNGSTPPKEFISAYRFSLMEGLVDLAAVIQPPDKKHPDELVATKEGIEGKIFHIFLPTNPVAHISAIYKSESDLLELRLIAQSIAIDTPQIDSSDEELVAMKLAPGWEGGQRN